MSKPTSTVLLSLLLAALSGCAAASAPNGASADAVMTPLPAAGPIGTFTSDQNGFDTHSFWVDTGSEVVVFDAQFTPELGQKVVDQIRVQTSHPIAWVVVTHPNPDKFQGVAPFRAAGAKVVASKATAAAIPGVYAYKKAYFVKAGMFTNETYPAPPVIDVTFEGETKVSGVELRELARPGVSSTQTVAWVPSTRSLVVGDLVHHRAHAWLEGGIVDGAPKPDLDGWKADLDELAKTYPADATVYGGRGESAPLGSAVAEEKAYLDGMKAIVTEEVGRLDHPVDVLTGAGGAAVYAKIQTRAAAAYPKYTLPYLVGYGVYGLALEVARLR